MKCVSFLSKHLVGELQLTEKVIEIIGFGVVKGDTRHFENLSKKTPTLNLKNMRADHYASYDLINPIKRPTGKVCYFTVKLMNRYRYGHYLAIFARKTYCQSKSPKIIKNLVP